MAEGGVVCEVEGDDDGVVNLVGDVPCAQEIVDSFFCPAAARIRRAGVPHGYLDGVLRATRPEPEFKAVTPGSQVDDLDRLASLLGSYCGNRCVVKALQVLLLTRKGILVMHRLVHWKLLKELESFAHRCFARLRWSDNQDVKMFHLNFSRIHNYIKLNYK